MIPSYDAKDLGDITLRAKEDAELVRGRRSVEATAGYVVRDEDGDKTIEATYAAVSFTTVEGIPGDTKDDGVVDLLDLSNVIDWLHLF
jgi:hypothetical protein